MNKKRTTLFLAAMSMALCAMADKYVQGMTITKTDGSSISVEIEAVRSIKFEDGTMVINKKDGGQQKVSVDEVGSISFESMASAITTITTNNGNTAITITDISGKVIFKGKAQEYDTKDAPHGIYIINANGRSYKTIIK